MPLLDGMFHSPAIDALFSDVALVASMLEFESALARAEARAGVIPASAPSAIASCCRAELFDFTRFAQSAPAAGNVAIPVVKQLTALVAKQNPEAARYVHWGATSQDVLDTALILQLRAALSPMLSDLDSLCDCLASLAEAHRNTPIVARSWLQHALPTSFGLIVAGWLDAVLRHRERFLALKQNALVLQFGGAVGTLAALGSRGPAVAKNLAEELHLPLPLLPWHSHRDRIAEVAATFGLLSGTIGKIAHDIALHSQTEIQELAEPSAHGRGVSSTMPHKQNPVTCAAIVGATARVPGLVSTILTAMSHEHQRGIGTWQSEDLPEIVRLAAGALHNLSSLAPQLQVNTRRMRENLDLTRGLIYAEAVSMTLAEKLGRTVAHERIESASQLARSSNRHLRDILSSESELASLLSPADLDRLFEPLNYLGSAPTFIDAVLAASRDRPPLQSLSAKD